MQRGSPALRRLRHVRVGTKCMKHLFSRHPVSLVLGSLFVVSGVLICYEGARSFDAVLFGVCVLIIGVRSILRHGLVNDHLISSDSGYKGAKSVHEACVEWLSVLSASCIIAMVLVVLVMAVSYNVNHTYNKQLTMYILVYSAILFVIFTASKIVIKIIYAFRK